MVVVDTISFARKLRDAGVPADQAEAHALAIHSYVQDFVTTEDLERAVTTIRGGITAMGQTLTIRLGGLIMAGVAALAAVIKLA